jgi:hypothetical protein
MKTLSTLFAIALLATTATGCKRTPQEKQAPATKPTEGDVKKDDKTAPVTPVTPDKPGDKAQDKAAPAVPDKPADKAPTSAATGS